jgi:hypothetical protein
VIPFDAACALVETALAGTFRRELVAELSSLKDLRQALLRLRDAMRSHVWKAGATRIPLDRFVGRYDTETRRDGFHALHDWDGKADHVNADTIAVDVLTYIADKRGAEPVDPTVVAIALDYYFVYVLALLSLRSWDAANPNAALDTVTRLLERLQGGGGSGQRFAADAATLLLIATSHFELDEGAYDRLLERARGLDRRHRVALAVVHAGSLGNHLRFGFDVTYGRDVRNMRDDNGVDYRWLLFSLATLMEEYARLRDEGSAGPARDVVVEALAGGLSPDAAAFVGDPPRSLSTCGAEIESFRRHFERHRADLIAELEPHRPADHAYSPLAFSFNFSHNVVKGIVVDALLWGEARTLTLNDLLTAVPREETAGAAKTRLAQTLAGYARASPDTIRGRPMPVIVYDPRAGRQTFSFMMRALKG